MCKQFKLAQCVLSFNLFLSISHRDPDKFQTTSNEAYNLVRQTTAVEAEYDIPQNIPPPPPPGLPPPPLLEIHSMNQCDITLNLFFLSVCAIHISACFLIV